MSRGAVANEVVCALSLVGGTGMVIGYFISPQKRLRQKMVLGLGVVDCLQALVVLVGTSYNLAGGLMETNGSACEASGFLYQTCVVASAGWTLSIAVVTYTTLVHPLSRLTASLESRWSYLVVWCIVWLIGLIPAIFGTVFFAQSDNGGVCWYDPKSIQAKLMIFVPRAVTLILVSGLYIRLFIFFRQRERSLLQTSVTGSGSDYETNGQDTGARGSVIAIGRSLAAWGRPGRHNSSSPESGFVSPPGEMKTERFASPTLSPIPQSPDLMPTNTQAQRHVFITLPQPTMSPDYEEPDSPDLDPNSFPLPMSPRDTKRISRQDYDAFVARQAAQAADAPRRKKRLTPRQINRRTSVLMMLYPLAYLVLFSVSVARLIVSISTNAPVHPRLTDAARLMVYLQGAVDGFIYFLCEWLFRKWNKDRS